MTKRWICLLCVVLAALSPAAALGEQMTLSFVGDCSIGEAIQFKGLKNTYTWTLDRQGYDWPFSLVREYLDADDYSFGNLEVVFTNRKKHADKKWPLVAAPEYADVLLYSGLDAVNTVNNHCFDFRVEGYQDTMETLDALGVTHFGSVYVGGKYEQDILLMADVKGVKIGATGFTYPQDKDLKNIYARIDTLRDAGCQLVIVSLHWGSESQPMPDSWQFKFARQIIDAGADVIWGHHAHVLQPVQFYNGGVIMYSMGNFTFGTILASLDRDTAILQLTYDIADGKPTLSRLAAIPCRVTISGDYRPYELTEEADRQRVFKKLVYKKEMKTMFNLPAGFMTTGVADIVDGLPVE